MILYIIPQLPEISSNNSDTANRVKTLVVGTIKHLVVLQLTTFSLLSQPNFYCLIKNIIK